MSADKTHLTIDVGGATDTQGTVEGSGTLAVAINDASQAALSVDYSTVDKVTITLTTQTGFRLKSHGLTLSAAGAVKPLSGEWLGAAGLAGMPRGPLPAAADDWLARSPDDGRHLLVLDALRAELVGVSLALIEPVDGARACYIPVGHVAPGSQGALDLVR